MNISALDLDNGTYGVMQTGVTAQNEKLSTLPALPVKAALPPPSGYSSWTQAYETGLLK